MKKDSYLKNIAKVCFYRFSKIIPKNNFGDKLFSLILFIYAYGRIPSEKKLLRNYIFKLKNSSEAINPLRVYITDKAFVKDYVAAKVGNEYNIMTIGVLNSFKEVKCFDFPRRCCIKPTHLSGTVILREDGEAINFKLINKWFRTNYYDIGREKNYRTLQPKVIVEPLVFGKTHNEDYKFFCFQGKAKIIQVDLDRHLDHTRLYLDTNWNVQPFSMLKKKSNKEIPQPANFAEMLKLADRLSSDFEFIRVDLYSNGEKIYVGELTNWPDNGTGKILPNSYEDYASKLIFNS